MPYISDLRFQKGPQGGVNTSDIFQKPIYDHLVSRHHRVHSGALRLDLIFQYDEVLDEFIMLDLVTRISWITVPLHESLFYAEMTYDIVI